MLVTSVIAAVLYAGAGALYLAYIAGRRERLAGLARAVLGCAVAAHAADIAVHCLGGQHPASNAREAVSFASFLMVGVYLLMSRRYRLAAVGALVSPAVLMLVITVRVTPAAAPALHRIDALGRVHIVLATVGVALFAVAAISSALYLVQARELKRKSFGALFHRGPPLELLDRVVQVCVSFGFPVFTLAIILGALWMARLGRSGLLVPQYLLALCTWFAFGGLLLTRVTAGWHGRRSAILAIFGFTSSLGVLVLYLLRAAFRV